MVKIAGIIFIALLVSLPIALLDFYTGSGFLPEFLRNQSAQVLGTILALNVATVTYLVSHLLTIEQNAHKTLFTQTKNEIKHNVYFMAVLLIVNLGLSAATQPIINGAKNQNLVLINALNYVNLVVFVLALFALMEMVSTIFKISHSELNKQ